MSGFIRPRYVGGGTAQGWSLADYTEPILQTPVAVAGLATLELPQLDDDERWLIDHAVVSTNSSTPTECRWYDSTLTRANVIEQTDNGNFDVSDWPSGLRVGPTRSLILQWTGCSAGSIGYLTMQVRVMRRPS